MQAMKRLQKISQRIKSQSSKNIKTNMSLLPSLHSQKCFSVKQSSMSLLPKTKIKKKKTCEIANLWVFFFIAQTRNCHTHTSTLSSKQQIDNKKYHKHKKKNAKKQNK